MTLKKPSPENTNKNKMKRNLSGIEDDPSRYRVFLDNIQDACFEFNLEGKCTFCNEAAHQALGYSRKEYISLTHRQRYAQESEADKVFQIFNEVYKTGAPSKLSESDMLRKDGSILRIEMIVSSIQNDQGEIVGFRGVGRDITCRKKEMIEMERYRNFLENIDDACFETDLKGNITYANNAAASRSGLTRDEMIGVGYRSHTNKEEAGRIFKTFNNVYLTGEPGIISDCEMYDRNGKNRFVEMSVSLIRDANGNPTGFRAISRDVTERKIAQESLRHSEEKYRSIIDNMQDAYFECDIAGKFTFANNVTCRGLGCSLGELLSLDYHAFTSPKTAERIKNIFQQTFQTGVPSTLIDYEIIPRNGNRRVHQLSVGLMRDAVGKPTGFSVLSRDVTQRIRAEEDLRRSEEKHRSILENMTEGYFEHALNGNILFVNDAGCAMLGYSRDQLCSDVQYPQFTTPETKIKMEQVYRKVFETGQASKLDDYEIIRRDGAIRTHQLSIALMKDTSGNKIGFWSVARDVTEKKQAEEDLRQSEERIRVLFNNIPVPTVVWKNHHDNLIMVEYNDAALQYTGGKIIDLVGKTVEECYPRAPHIAIDMHQCFSLRTNIEKSFWFSDNNPDKRKYLTIKYAFAPPDNIIMHVNDSTAQKKAEENLKYISIHDALTGLYNRFYSDAEINRIKSSRLRPVSFIIIDLNDLKVINDLTGHATGDLYIKNTAALLRKTFRPEDMIARIGGDEFIVVLPLVGENTCLQTLARLQDNLSQFNKTIAQPISLAAGFSTAYAGDNIEAVIAAADRLMYQEKSRMKANAGGPNLIG